MKNEMNINTNKDTTRGTTLVSELKPINTNQKSFYGKAHIINHADGRIELQSYNTIVASYSNIGSLTVYGSYSRTTARHIKEFMSQLGFPPMGTQEILEKYGEDK